MYEWQSHFSSATNSHYQLPINYTFSLKLLICCLLIFSKVVYAKEESERSGKGKMKTLQVEVALVSGYYFPHFYQKLLQL